MHIDLGIMSEHAFPAISKFDMRWLFVCTEGIEHLHPRSPQTECKEGSKSQADKGSDCDVGADLVCGASEGIAIGVLQVVLEMLLC